MTLPAPHRLSQAIADMLAASAGPVTIDQALKAMGGRSFGGVMIVLALPSLFLPPGVSVLVGAPLFLVSAQLLASRKEPWLPGLIRRRGLRRQHAERVYRRASPMLQRSETWLRPRLEFLVFPFHDRLIAAACLAMSVIVMSPIPFAHTAGALGISAFGAGLMERDGLALLAGWGLAITCAALVAAVIFGAIATVRVL